MFLEPIIQQLRQLWHWIVGLPSRMSRVQKYCLVTLLGCFVGCGFYFLYLLRAQSYLGDDPSACVNCHIMSPYYATWFHSSHSRNATCNDCHVPHENVARKYAFKATDGMKHVAKFLAHQKHQAIRSEAPSNEIIMNNCIRCHQELTTTLSNTGKVTYMQTAIGQGKVCWDCHRQVPHGGRSSLAGTSDAKVPLPASPVPTWLQKALE